MGVVNYQMHCQQAPASYSSSLAPRPPPFFVLRFSFSITHGSGLFISICFNNATSQSQEQLDRLQLTKRMKCKASVGEPGQQNANSSSDDTFLMLTQPRLSLFPGSHAWEKERKPGTLFVHVPSFLSNLHTTLLH